MREILLRQPDIVGKIGGEFGRFARDERGSFSDLGLELVGAGSCVGGGAILAVIGTVEIATFATFEAVGLAPNFETVRQAHTLLRDGVVHMGQGSIGIGIGLGIGALFDRLDRTE